MRAHDLISASLISALLVACGDDTSGSSAGATGSGGGSSGSTSADTSSATSTSTSTGASAVDLTIGSDDLFPLDAGGTREVTVRVRTEFDELVDITGEATLATTDAGVFAIEGTTLRGVTTGWAALRVEARGGVLEVPVRVRGFEDVPLEEPPMMLLVQADGHALLSYGETVVQSEAGGTWSAPITPDSEVDAPRFFDLEGGRHGLLRADGFESVVEELLDDGAMVELGRFELDGYVATTRTTGNGRYLHLVGDDTADGVYQIARWSETAGFELVGEGDYPSAETRVEPAAASSLGHAIGVWDDVDRDVGGYYYVDGERLVFEEVGPSGVLPMGVTMADDGTGLFVHCELGIAVHFTEDVPSGSAFDFEPGFGRPTIAARRGGEALFACDRSIHAVTSDGVALDFEIVGMDRMLASDTDAVFAWSYTADGTSLWRRDPVEGWTSEPSVIPNPEGCDSPYLFAPRMHWGNWDHGTFAFGQTCDDGTERLQIYR